MKDKKEAGYIYAFEILHQYPTVRTFIVRGPLKRSFMDTVTEFLVGPQKRAV